jgi:L,D-transpeptidase YcbB
MAKIPPFARTSPLNRRIFLRRMGQGVAAAAVMAPWLKAAAADDGTLQALIEQNQRNNFSAGFDSASRTIQMPQPTVPTLGPSTLPTTEQAIQQYQTLVARGGWPPLPAQDQLRLGNRNPNVVLLRRRLTAAGDLAGNAGVPDVFDSYVEAAVRRFQARHGIDIDGIVREETYKALNIPASVRLAQLQVNIARLRKLGGNLGERFVMCNIPAAQIEAVENGIAVSRHTAIVGKPDRPSPEIQSHIIQINFNPYWTVPVSIVRRDLIPKMQQEPDYLTKYHIRIFDQRGHELQPADINWYSEEAVNYMFKQDPGDFNSLGQIRINFPNTHEVYMHDTPSKNLFGEDFRFLSSGCVRIQNVRELVDWLLRDTPGWSPQEIEDVLRSGERKDAQLIKPVPVYWVYLTAWATGDGIVQFRNDIYGRDGIPGVVAASTPG